MAYTQEQLLELKDRLREDGFRSVLTLAPAYKLFTNNSRFVLFDTRGKTRCYKTFEEVVEQLDPKRFAVTVDDLIEIRLDEGLRLQLGVDDHVAYVNPHDRRQFFVVDGDDFLVVDPDMDITRVYFLEDVLNHFSNVRYLFNYARFPKVYPEAYWFEEPGVDLIRGSLDIRKRLKTLIAKRGVLA